MTIDHSETIDAIGTERKSGDVILTIIDHLDWKNPVEHMSLLERKIFSYLEFIFSNQIEQVYPASKGKKIRIAVVGKYQVPSRFIRQINSSELAVQLKSTGVPLDFQHRQPA